MAAKNGPDMAAKWSRYGYQIVSMSGLKTFILEAKWL